MKAIRTISVLLAMVLVTACASRPINEPLEKVDLTTGYRANLLIPKRENNELSTLFVLSFSGGGTRAASFAYGVLEELRRYEYVTADGQTRNLLDEVDMITGVSGGSFTALSYALYGDRLFDEFEDRFLKRNVQGALSRRGLNPFNWGKLLSGDYGRSELAAEYYDEILFEGATFNDLLARNAPVAIANGTDITSGARFAFHQYDFDLICSDLGNFRLSRAAATSSAVPLVLSPVTLTNYSGSCGYEHPAWVNDILEVKPRMRPAGRALYRFREMEEFRDSARNPYLHLVDGGVSDNIGVRGVLEAQEQFFISESHQKQRGFNQVRRFIIIVVNAKSDYYKDWREKESPPGSIKQLVQSSGVPIARYSFETVELMKDRAEVASWRRRLLIAEAQLEGMSREEAEAKYPGIELNVLDISFDAIQDPEEKTFLMNLPTSFVLEDEEVDRLRKAASSLLRQSPIYQEIVNEWGARRLD